MRLHVGESILTIVVMDSGLIASRCPVMTKGEEWKNGLLSYFAKEEWIALLTRNGGNFRCPSCGQIDSMPTDCALPDIAAHITYAPMRLPES